MAVLFLDSSALLKRYVRETGSVWVNALFDLAAGNTMLIAGITPVEIVAAITRRARGGTTTPAEAAYACTLFRTELPTDYQSVPLTDAVLTAAMALAETHGLRGYDAVQLATLLEVNRAYTAARLLPITLISADAELNTAAAAEGLRVEDPNAHP